MLHLISKSLNQRAGAFARYGFARYGFARYGCCARRSGGQGIVAAVALVLCVGPVLAGDPPASAEDLAQSTVEEAGAPRNETADVRALADDALAEADESLGHADLEDWTRSVIADALERVGAVAETSAGAGAERTAAAGDPLPAERHAAQAAEGLWARQGRNGLPARRGTAEVLVFLSLAVPEESWAQWAAEAARAGAPLVLRGVLPAGLRATVTEVGRRLGGHEAGVAIDPRLFRLFGVERVPAVVAVPGGVPACASRGCADDTPPPFDSVGGNIGLGAALEAIGAEGDAARETARRHLKRLGRRP